jgi:hypothetical protein
MPSSYRKKPLAQLEHGTRIYAPSAGESRYRVVANDPVSGERIFAKCRTEEQARSKARELEQFIAQCAPSAIPPTRAPVQWSVSPTATSMITCRGCRCGSGKSRPTCRSPANSTASTARPRRGTSSGSVGSTHPARGAGAPR